MITKTFSNVDSSVAVKHLSENAKLGKDNPIIVKALILLIEDINYEISCSLDYLSNLESTIKRLKIAKDYNDKMLKASNDKKDNIILRVLNLIWLLRKILRILRMCFLNM